MTRCRPWLKQTKKIPNLTTGSHGLPHRRGQGTAPREAVVHWRLMVVTPWKTNMEPKKLWFVVDVFLFPTGLFQVYCSRKLFLSLENLP